MPYKTGKMKGELTTPEIRKLIKAHNVLVSIKIPKGAKREDIMNLVKKNGYMVDHEKQALIPKVQMKRRPKVDMKKVDKVLPKPKTKEEKAAAKKERDMKKKEKEDKIKAEGVKQGAALQRVISKRKKKEEKPKPKTASIGVGTEKAKKEDKKEIITVFKDIAVGFKEILEEASAEDRNNREIKSIKIVIDKLKKGSMSFTETQKKIIKRAIDSYLDMDFAGDPELQREVSIAKKLQAKYK